ncbi:methylthioribose-1-phosphate isomerase [Halyomorpha halys]|uniref:methylthioribose-1-phosphate isomerase n=1 Tax=Halyomorpha halys TaxID=286706 RepID=UPI0006D4EABA|nr:methylthioribose-1-phosphate isomerase [Halyomorpha halys]
MFRKTLKSIKYNEGDLEILDQLLLPGKSEYRKIIDVEEGWEAIHNMHVRGAPAIAIVGCLSIAVELYRNSYESKEELHDYLAKKFDYLVTARPTAVNLMKEAEILTEYSGEMIGNAELSTEDMRICLIKAIEDLLSKDICDNKTIGTFGADEILNGQNNPCIILTHCNTGSLATADYGTALGVIRTLHERSLIEQVYCTETRPFMQGARLTAYELVYEGIPSTLICDSAVAALFKNTRVTAVVVGADRVVANGDTANKIGTYQIAVLAKYHNVPFYVCAPLSSIDFDIKTGHDIVIEERSEKEMAFVGETRIAAQGITCWNPAFDVTPSSLITGIVTEKGVFHPEKIGDLLQYS